MMKRPRSLLIEPPYGEPKVEPNGLLYLATYARQHGYEVDLLYESQKTRFTVEQAVERAVRGGYDLVGLNAMTPTLPRALAILAAAKAARPETIGVLGGYHATIAHDRVLTRHPQVDIAVRGEGEHTFVELLGRLSRGDRLDGCPGLSFRRQGEVVVNELRPLTRHLDELPFPDRSLGPGGEEYVRFYDPDSGRPLLSANVTSSRGCPYGCAFCVLGSDDPGSPISLRRWRARTPANVVDEIEQLIRTRGVGCIAFVEDNFTVSPRRLEEFADLVLERGLNFVFTCDARANQICRLERVIPKLRRAGLRKIECGIESGSQAVLDRFAKGTTVEDNVRALRILRDNDIMPRIDFIMFDPLTTVEDLERNAAFLRQHAPPWYEHSRTIFQKLELHPGTELQRQYLAAGLVQGEPDEILAYEFAHPEVGRLFDVLDRFYWNHQLRLDELRKRMHYLQVWLRDRGEHEQTRRLAADLVYQIVPLNSLALRLFETTLRAGKQSGFDRLALERAVRPFEERTAALEQEFEQLLAGRGLVDQARESYTAAQV